MLHKSAILSPDRMYRYTLSRTWSDLLPGVCFVMLNPSLADAEQDDPTLRRCIGFATRWGFGRLEVVNLYAYRSPYPTDLRLAPDPIGPDNDTYIARASGTAALTVVAWGVLGHIGPLRRDILPLLTDPQCLAITRTGAPKHPLYVAGANDPIPYR